MGRIIPNEETFIGFTLAKPGSLTVPTATATEHTTGGVLAAGTYGYRVSAADDSGVTVPSTEATATTTGTTSSVTVAWAAIDGAQSYKIYGRTSGSELLLATVSGSTLSWVDTGALTPAGAMPTVNTSAKLDSPTVEDIEGCIDLTHFVSSLNASATGNAVPTPALDTLFETSILGTSQATFTGDFYRDDENDVAWETLTRATRGYFIITRFGGQPTTIGDNCEVWPVTVLSRAMANMANNTVESFTVTCAVPVEPAEDAVVVA